ncbi:hypothetical protein SNE40_017593 [Patella caerulea]|uniref:Protein FAM204A n=1 Tax=Patella caerulea TaxID=87958 RepID=A0AAN8PG36_PATCE
METSKSSDVKKTPKGDVVLGETKSSPVTEIESSTNVHTSDSVPAAPKNVSKRLWEKFKLLEKRTDEATKHSREKRIKELQKKVLTKVTEEIQDDAGKVILQKYDVKFGPSIKDSPRKQQVDKTGSCTSGDNEDQWNEVKELLDVNQHLEVGTGLHRDKTELEKKIDEAVNRGDIQTAEELSDRLANRQFGKKISDAVEARDYLKRKKIEDDSVKQKKKKKLHWGFQEKERWETKGNM